VPGVGPVLTNYHFEEWPPERWPNIVTLDFSLNIKPGWGISGLVSLDQLVAFLNSKWRKKGLKPPRYLIFDFMWVRSMFRNCPVSQSQDSAARYMAPNDIDNVEIDPSFNRGTVTNSYVRSFASFYGYPLVSTAELFWNPFAKLYMDHGMCMEENMFPLLPDGVHFNCATSRYFANVVILPFFQQQIDEYSKLLVNEVLNMGEYIDPHSLKIYMFPKKHYEELAIIIHCDIWGSVEANTEGLFSCKKSTDNQAEIVVLSQNHHWSIIPVGNHSDGLHNIFGFHSDPADSLIEIGFFASEPADRSIKVQYDILISHIVSWNAGAYGDLKCSLFKKAREPFAELGNDRSNNVFEPLGDQNVLILSNSCNNDHVNSTGLCSKRFPVPIEHRHWTKLRCQALDTKMVGFGRISLIRRNL
jgi:hypothetical protein